MIKYLGSKRVLVPRIRAIAAGLPVASACDLFAGTTRVAQALRELGLHVLSNDVAAYSEPLGQAYVVRDERVDRRRVARLLAHLAGLPPREGYVTEVFCRRARYFQPENGARIDAIRAEIDRLELTPVERGILLTSLLEAADRVDSTCGLQMAYLKRWSARSYQQLELREPRLVAGPPGAVATEDANALAPGLDGFDLAYLDPPYNQHSYLSNYHVWETLVRGDEPEHYGVACKRVDCRTRKSPYNSRRLAWGAFADLVASLPCPWLIVSFSDEGFFALEDVRALLAARGYVAEASVDFTRYVGAKIGIYNPSGERVGSVSHTTNREHLFVVGPSRSAVESAIAV